GRSATVPQRYFVKIYSTTTIFVLRNLLKRVIDATAFGSATVGRGMPMNWWIRGYLLFAVVQGFGIGLTGLLVPSEMQIPLRLSPLNSRFVAVLYVAGGIGVMLAALSKRRSEARLFVVGFGIATVLILL